MEVKALQIKIVEWANSVFPDRSVTNAIQKLALEEIPEFLLDQTSEEELADILILVLDIAFLSGIDIEKAVLAKLEVNKQRQWEINETTGLMNHVEPEISVDWAGGHHPTENEKRVVKAMVKMGIDNATWSSTYDDLGMDSLDAVEVVMAMEEEFEIELADSYMAGVTSVPEMVAAIDKVIGAK